MAARERGRARHRGARPLFRRLRGLPARLAGRRPRLRGSRKPGGRPLTPVLANALAVATHSLSAEGIREETLEALLRPVSRLALEPVAAQAQGDFRRHGRPVIPPVQAHSLWRHWEQPRIGWYQGAHQRFIRSPEGRKVLEDTFRAADMLPRKQRNPRPVIGRSNLVGRRPSWPTPPSRVVGNGNEPLWQALSHLYIS